jgi:hypothetical protein
LLTTNWQNITRYEARLRKIDRELEKAAPDSLTAQALRTSSANLVYEIEPALVRVDFMKRFGKIVTHIRAHDEAN